MRIIAISAVLLALSGCDSGSTEDSAQPLANPAVPAEPGSAETAPEPLDSVVLIPVALESSGVAVPNVGGSGPVVDRVNAVLERTRRIALADRRECASLATGNENEIDYEYVAEPRYNADGLLSFRVSGLASCGGANPTTLTGAITFDLATGERIDVAALSGSTRDELAELGRSHYTGEAQCAAFLRDNPAKARLDHAFIDREGLGLVYAFDAGAAESCAAEPAVIPAALVQSRLQPANALRRAWSGADARSAS